MGGGVRRGEGEGRSFFTHSLTSLVAELGEYNNLLMAIDIDGAMEDIDLVCLDTLLKDEVSESV